MSVTIKSTNGIPKLMQSLQKLGGKHVDVGYFGKDSNVDKEGINIVTLARVHEYGMTIKPKKGKFLAIPTPLARGKRPKDFSDLTFMPTRGGAGGVLMRETRGRGKAARSDIFFILVRSVTIPERSFLRSGFDKHIGEINKMVDAQVDQVIQHGINPDTYLNMLGMHITGILQQHAIREVNSPKNAAITAANKKSANPLVDTGRMIGAMRHEVRTGK